MPITPGTKIIKTVLQISVAVQAVWESSTEIIPEGMPCYTSDTKILKIGDGVNTWSALSPVTGGGSMITLSDQIDLDSSDTGASSKAVKTAYDKASQAHTKAEQALAAAASVTIGAASQVFGICRYKNGGGSGLWMHIGEDETNVTSFNNVYFDHHAIYSRITRVFVDDQLMCRIPKFYIKHLTGYTGPTENKHITMISPTQRSGYKVHPAFMQNGSEIEEFYFGCYPAGIANGKATSLPSGLPMANVNFAQAKARCEARNVNGVYGFMMSDIYQRSVIDLLMLLEFGTPDMQSILGMGHTQGTAPVAVDHGNNHRPWRYIHGLYGNIWQMTDGLKLDENRYIHIFSNTGDKTWINTQRQMAAFSGSSPTGWVVDMHDHEGEGFDLKDVFIPKTTSTNLAAGNYADNCYAGSPNGILYKGGLYSDSTNAGIFFISLASNASFLRNDIGTRLTKV